MEHFTILSSNHVSYQSIEREQRMNYPPNHEPLREEIIIYLSNNVSAFGVLGMVFNFKSV